MCTHLQKRGSTYYFRRVIPEDVRGGFDGRREWIYSLGTKDRDEGKERAHLEAVRTNGLIATIRAQIVAGESPMDSGGASPQPVHWTRPITEWELEQADHDEQAAEAVEGRRRKRRHHGEEFRRRIDKYSTAQLGSRDAGIRDDFRGVEERARVAEEHLAIARSELAQRLPAAVAIAAPEPVEVPRPEPVADPDAMMLDGTLIDQWSKERGVSRRGVVAHKAVATWFYERAGRKPVADITRADVLLFKNKLIAEGQTLANTKMKLSRLRTLLQWAFMNDKATSNAGAGIVVIDTNLGRNRRKEFDLASLRAIFSSPVYSENLRPAQGRGEAAYWLPLLALFTGARMEELGQLRPSDVTLLSYVDGKGQDQAAWVINIMEDDEDNLTLKNSGSERVVPVHPDLERLGFIEYVKAAVEAKHGRLFPDLKPNTYDRLTAKWGEWFGRYKRECGVTDRRMVFHSFRHTFKHYARHANIIEGVQRQIMGHSSGDVADGYGSGYTVHQLVEGMKLFNVPGLKV